MVLIQISKVTPIGMNDGQWHQVVWVSNGEENGNMFFFDGEPISLTWQDSQDPNGIWFNDQDTDTHSIAAFGRYDLDYLGMVSSMKYVS
jgi:hypothetical protein